MEKSYYRKLYIYAANYFSHGIPNKTHKKQKHRAHLKVPTILVLSSFTPQKSKSHETTSHLHKHVLSNMITLEIPDERHHSPNQRPIKSWFKTMFL
jgi:hypothetical protein